MAPMSKDRGRAVRLFRALSDETRLRILDHLRDGEECVCNLTGPLGTAQSLLSFHLRILKEAGLIQDRRQGRWVYYALNPDALGEIGAVVETFKKPRRGLRLSAPACR